MSECHPVKQVDSLERDTKPLLFRALRLAEVSMLAWNIAVALTLSVCLSVSQCNECLHQPTSIPPSTICHSVTPPSPPLALAGANTSELASCWLKVTLHSICRFRRPPSSHFRLCDVIAAPHIQLTPVGAPPPPLLLLLFLIGLFVRRSHSVSPSVAAASSTTIILRCCFCSCWGAPMRWRCCFHPWKVNLEV